MVLVVRVFVVVVVCDGGCGATVCTPIASLKLCAVLIY